MQHSVTQIGLNRENISVLRKDIYKFNAKDFFEFAKNNKDKYGIIENGDDLLVGTWYCNDLIDDYKKTRKMKIFKSDAGCGYQEYAYVTPIRKSKNGYDYLCLWTNERSTHPTHVEGQIVEDLEAHYLEEVEVDVNTLEISKTFLFQFFVENHSEKAFGIVRWHGNVDDDIICKDKATAESYVEKYNKLKGETKCYVDENVWLPYKEI